MCIFDWTEDGRTVTEEFLLHNGFIRCRQYTNHDVITYSIHSRGGDYGIVVNLELQAMLYKTVRGEMWHHCKIGDTQQIELLLSQLKNRL